ncbi:MAG TPA: hypothetical protein VMV31_02050 [Terriglobales bacterium]|nr:hypothetical protein [Terriglobales bacterium]
MGAIGKSDQPIVYFEEEGRGNLARVVSVIKRTMVRRPDLRKVIFFTAFGEGPALAYNRLQGLDATIIAVTFPLTFRAKHGDRVFAPCIEERAKQYFNDVGIKVLTGRLPWDESDGCDSHNREIAVIKKSLSLFGGSFPLCVQAVLQACDMGAIAIGERVIAATGDCAAVVTATATQYVFSKDFGLSINEILCKPRNPTLLYAWAKRAKSPDNVFELGPGNDDQKASSDDASTAPPLPFSQSQSAAPAPKRKP